jgi:tetratricopeptide (TPR) repeat protein
LDFEVAIGALKTMKRLASVIGSGSALAALLLASALLPAAAAPIKDRSNSVAAQSESPFLKQLTEGSAAMERKDYGAAARAFEQAAKLEPKSPLPLLALAEVAQARGQPKLVEERLKQALELAPGSAEVQRAWGRWLYGKGQFDPAEAALKQAASLRPDFAGAYIDLGDLYLQGLKRPAEAAQVYRRAIELAPDHAGARFGLARALSAQGKTSEAIDALEEAIRLAPENPAPLLALGRLQLSAGSPSKALAAFDRAAALQPSLVAAQSGRGDALMAIKDYAGAELAYRAALKSAPKDADLHFQLGAALLAMQKFPSAEVEFKTAVQINPRLSSAYNNLAWIEVATKPKGDLNAALGWAKKATELQPEVGQFWHTLGMVQLARKDNEAAVAALAKPATASPPRAQSLYLYGVALARAGRKPEAVLALKRALEVGPSLPEAPEARRLLAELGA